MGAMANKKNKSRKGTGHANKAWKDRARTAEVERDALSAEVATLRTELEMADAQVAAGRETLAHHASEVSTSVTHLVDALTEGITKAQATLVPFQAEIDAVKEGKLPASAERIEDLAKANRFLLGENRRLKAQVEGDGETIAQLQRDSADSLKEALDIRKEGYLGTRLTDAVMKAIPEGTDLAGQQAFLAQLNAHGAGWPKALSIILNWFLKRQREQAEAVAAAQSITIGDLIGEPEGEPVAEAPEVEPEAQPPVPEDEAQPEAAPEPAAEPESLTDTQEPEVDPAAEGASK